MCLSGLPVAVGLAQTLDGSYTRGAVSQSNFPYAQLAGLQAYRNAALLDLSQRKPQLLEQQPESGSLILVAATALSKRLIELHRDPEQLRRIERRLFEEVVAELFHGFGYSVELTARTRD